MNGLDADAILGSATVGQHHGRLRSAGIASSSCATAGAYYLPGLTSENALLDGVRQQPGAH